MKIAARVIALAVLLAASVISQADTMGPFGEKVILRAGGMYANQNTRLQFTGKEGLGASVDLEDFFGLEEELSKVGQFMVQGRFKQRHRIGAQYYAFKRSAESVLQEDWEGDDIDASAGARADTKLNIAILDVSYSYSFIRNEKHELAGTAGLFWMDVDLAIQLQGDLIVDGKPINSGSAEAGFRLAAPLPLIGVNYNYAIKPRWLVGASFKYFTLRTGTLDGAIVMVSADTRYYFWDHFEVGGGLTIFDLGGTFNTGEFKGTVDWSFWGPQAFIGVRF